MNNLVPTLILFLAIFISVSLTKVKSLKKLKREKSYIKLIPIITGEELKIVKFRKFSRDKFDAFRRARAAFFRGGGNVLIGWRSIVNNFLPRCKPSRPIKQADNRIREAYTGAPLTKDPALHDPWMMVVNGKFGGRRSRAGRRTFG